MILLDINGFQPQPRKLRRSRLDARRSRLDARRKAQSDLCTKARYKQMFGDGLRAKREEARERETAIACGLLNRMLELGRPQSYRVG